ncbi:peptidoglycan DD-metalloendopeptidase family protein [Candidatus Parcubacteria bacterium]|nr:peptidoglycan DD-metalloendopeptidase family protein [Candidatus Parcubacteria bacterium]
MRRTIFAILFLSVLLGSVSLIPPLPTRADSVDDIKEQIEDINRQRRELDEEIKEYQRQLNVLSGEKHTLQGAIQTLDVSRNKTASQIKSIQGKIAGATLKLSQLSFEIDEKEASIALDKAAVASSLRAIDSADDVSLIEQLFAAEALADAWILVDNLASLNQALQTHATILSEAKVVLADQQEQVSVTKNELSYANVDLQNQKKALDVNRQEKETLLSVTKSKEAEYQALIAEKKAEQAAFESELYRLSTELGYAVDPASIPQSGSGVLLWPLDDVFVTQEFGRTVDSKRLYVSGTHDGVDFRASVGTPVRSALTGTVLEVNHGSVANCQYGKWVLVRHANGLATLYAHLSSIAVSKGDAVRTGEIVGNSGMTGYATGPHLHFAVYVADAISLKQYTCKSGYTVTIPIAPPEAYLNPMSYI